MNENQNHDLNLIDCTALVPYLLALDEHNKLFNHQYFLAEFLADTSFRTVPVHKPCPSGCVRFSPAPRHPLN